MKIGRNELLVLVSEDEMGVFTAKGLGTGFQGQGKTEEEAIQRLKETLETHYKKPFTEEKP